MRVNRSIDGAARLGAGLLALLALPLAAQETAAPAGSAAAGSTEATLVVDDEVMALVAPVALYPDPLLAVILQASMFPVDVVQAARFVEDYEEDQTLEPSEEWDPSLIALLNYPPVLAEMNEHLDWTQAMGDAVYDQLEDVQYAVQDLRQGAFAMGVLVSNDVQEVVVEERIVQIRPATEGPIAIPQYDGAALLAALQPVGEAPADAAATAETAPETAEAADETESDLAEREAALAQREADVAAREADVADREQAESDVAEAVADETYAEPATEYADAAAVDPYASSYAPADPSYVQPPVYAAPPPAVTYAQPPSSGWSTFGTFLGGAALGGLLGYAIFDDDDDDNGGNNRRNDINIEDSTIVIGGDGDRLELDRDEKNRINAELRDRRDRNERVDRGDRRDRTRQIAALPDRRDAHPDRDRGRGQAISLPQRDQGRAVNVERRQERATPALKPPQQRKGAVADIKRPSQTKKDASRGKKSRDQAVAKRGERPQRQVAQRGDGGGKRALGAERGGKKHVKAKSDRGKKSRGRRRG